jgi:tRNA (mo5U34)-methyltransferase
MSTGDPLSLAETARDLPVLAIGGADGDLSFLLERAGFQVDFVDWPLTNQNGMRGVSVLRSELRSTLAVSETDLDSQFCLPRSQYGFVFALGLPYHLKNPFYFLESLARHVHWCVLSTRVFQTTTDRAHHLGQVPVAYLADPDETNGDATDYWMFTVAGLRRLVIRSGWTVARWCSVGCQVDSDPASSDRDERAFCLLQSRSSGALLA